MSKIIAIGATATAVALLVGTFVITQTKTRALGECGTTAVAGAALGGPFELVDKTGKTVTDLDVITKPTLVYFGYAFCPDVCPLDMARNAAAMDILAEQGIDAGGVFITIDPARDTSEVVGEYAENFHPEMIGLTGTAAQVDAAVKAYRVVASRQDDDPEYYLMQHSTFSYLVMPDRGFVDFFRQVDTPEQVADRVACFAATS